VGGAGQVEDQGPRGQADLVGEPGPQPGAPGQVDLAADGQDADLGGRRDDQRRHGLFAEALVVTGHQRVDVQAGRIGHGVDFAGPRVQGRGHFAVPCVVLGPDHTRYIAPEALDATARSTV
jgi:hypothetical protein